MAVFHKIVISHTYTVHLSALTKWTVIIITEVTHHMKMDKKRLLWRRGFFSAAHLAGIIQNLRADNISAVEPSPESSYLRCDKPPAQLVREDSGLAPLVV